MNVVRRLQSQSESQSRCVGFVHRCVVTTTISQSHVLVSLLTCVQVVWSIRLVTLAVPSVSVTTVHAEYCSASHYPEFLDQMRKS